jgi:hypothetical protein
MAPNVTEENSAPAVGTEPALFHAWSDPTPVPGAPVTEPTLPSEILADLDDPSLVLSDGYIGSDRRTVGLWAGLRRATFSQRRSLLRLEGVVLVLAVVVVAASVLLVGSGSPTHVSATAVRAHPADAAPVTPPTTALAPATTTPPTTVPAPTTTDPAAVVPAPAPPATTPPAPAAASAPPVTAPPASTASLTPAQLGAQALTLVRYPWQSIPGYSIQFQPISAAPSPDFYGNTTFTWGQTGGTSVLYVYPGETVERLAGITAFEIAHEVDAAAVQPQGGEAQIENVLDIHPASWAPNCDCAEQGFLSGWYAAAFSNYWSPGVGNWSSLAPMPTGATLTAVEPWLNPTIS